MFLYGTPDMISLATHVILYGFDSKIPTGGFPTKGYKSVMDELERIKDTITIFPESTYQEVCREFYWSQKTRWAFKRLLLFWNDYRFKDQYGNEEDLYGNSFDDYEEPILTLWDWRSRRYYRFGYTELIEHGYSKLNAYAKPTNPYINMAFTYYQCVQIYNFLKEHDMLNGERNKKSIFQKYTRFPDNMFLNTQTLMEQDGFIKIQDHIQTSSRSLAEDILLYEIIDGDTSLKNDKISLSEEMKNILFRLIVNDKDDVSYIPDTKCEKIMFEIFVRFGLDETIDYYNRWLHHNRNIFKIRRNKIRGSLYNIVMNNI